MVFAWLIKLYTWIPHFSFAFKNITPDFDTNWKSEYAQSLALIAAAVGAIALLLLLTIVITWICQCCSKDDITGKSRRKVRRLSIALFLLSISCFIALGLCVFANEHINRGVQSSINGLSDVNRQMKLGVAQTKELNTTTQNSTLHVQQLEDLVHTKSQEPGVNQTLVGEIDGLMTNISDRMDSISHILRVMERVLGEVSFLDTVKQHADFYELERWLTMLFLLAIMICVFFSGVISFCRQSKSGAVCFSGVGLVIFIVSWILLAIVVAASVALADFCYSGDKYIKQQISQPMIDTLEFYRTCSERVTHDNVPTSLQANNVSDMLTEIQNDKAKLDSLLDRAFNHSEAVTNMSALFATDTTKSLKQIGALESTVACYAFKNDVRNMHEGICEQAVFGASLMVLALLLLGLFLFFLLITVSKSWNLFSRLPSDYVEVDEDDPFFPRTNDSNIPVDIYGTHVFNPRTRERTEPSTNTTSATANEEQTVPLWRNSQQPSVSGNYAEQPYGNYQGRYEV